MRCPFEKFATRQSKDAVVVRAGPDVGRVPGVPDPTIFSGVFLADRLSGVSRRVVGYDQLKILIVLPEQAAECAGKVPLAVEHGETDTDSWVSRFHRYCSASGRRLLTGHSPIS